MVWGLGGLSHRFEGAFVTPNGPDDARELVGDGHGGLVVHVSLRNLVCPLSKVVGALASRVHEDGARAVDEEGT